MTEKLMELGERRRITLKIWLEDDKAFTPLAPTWELSKAYEVQDQGECIQAQDGTRWELTAEVEPKGRGDYRLTYQFGIGTEIIRRSIKLKVV